MQSVVACAVADITGVPVADITGLLEHRHLSESS